MSLIRTIPYVYLKKTDYDDYNDDSSLRMFE